MYQAQLAINEVKRFYKRRKKIVLVCLLLILSISVGAAFWLPPKYKASTTILVQKEETLNPMVRFNMAVALASEDRLKSFNEIIYSRSTMNVVIDSLGLAKEGISPIERENLIQKVRENIDTNLRASDSFSITYTDTDPRRAKEAVNLLSNYFIKTKLRFENRRNNQTVEFFRSKLNELKRIVEKREKTMTKNIEESVVTTPRENQSLQLELDRISEQRAKVNLNISDIRRKLELVRDVNRGDRELSALYQLDLSSLDTGERMDTLLTSYKKYTRKYTTRYPRVQEMDRNIRDLTERLISELEAKLFRQQAQKSFLDRQYKELTQSIQQSTMENRKASQAQLDLDVYRNLYDEMKVKLEQAKTTRDLGKKARDQFIVIDPPVIPREPSEPNKVMLVGGGLGLGLFLGLIAAVVAELLDTTVRRPEDLKKFNKPVVAFISERKN